MTPEQRVDRLEAIASLFVAAEQRRRKNLREQQEKIGILINMQIKSEERFNERFDKNEERFARNEERFTRTEQVIDRLITAQARTHEKLQELIETLRRNDRGGLFA
jgi:hypothetical protein